MTIEEVRKQLIDGLEDCYTPKDIEFIDIRLQEIAEMEHFTNEELNEYCWANSSEMFTCIFNYKEFDVNNFEVD
jgi:hypothetical protein